MRHFFYVLFFCFIMVSAFGWSKEKDTRSSKKIITVNNLPGPAKETDAFKETGNKVNPLFKNQILQDCDFDILLDSRSDVTNCSNPNGKLSIKSTAGSLNSAYTIRWYNQIGTLVSTNSQASNLDLGNYVVQVSRNGCTVSKTYEVEAGLPNLSVEAIAHVTSCANINSGHARATLSGDISSSDKFTVTWYGGPSTAYPIIKSTTNLSVGAVDNITTLAPGSYAVTVEGSGSNNCQSDASVITIEDQRTYPVISIAPPVNNTICSPGAPNGSLTGSVAGGSTGHTFAWFLGQNTLASNQVSTSPTATGLAPGIYTLRVTRTSTGCSSTMEATVGNATIIPVVSANITSGLTNCISPNGSATATVGGTTSGYTFRWYIGSTIKATPDFTGSSYTSLSNQAYTVTATNNSTLCVSTPVTINIPDGRILPNISLSTTPNTNCAPVAPNGSLSANVGGTTAGYSFQWYTGGLPISGSPISTSSTITGRAAGQYSVRVTNNASGCASTATVTLGNQITTPIVNFSKTDQSVCVPGNGSITVNSVTESGSPGSLSNYSFTLYNADGTTPSGISGSPFNGLVAGTYYLEARNITTGCLSVKAAITIANISVAPAVIFTKVPNSSCDPATANGSLTANATTSGSPSAGGYSYRWFSGGLPVSGSPLAITQTASSLIGQTYSVEVTDLSTGCSTTVSTTLNNAPATPVITPVITAQTICLPANGSVTVSSITENGVSVPLSEYNFTLYVADGVTNSGLNGIPFTGLAAGTYFIEAEHAVRKCTAVMEISVANNSVLPVISFSKTPNTSCDPAAPNGTLTASATTGGSASAGGYSYRWFNGGLPPSGGPVGNSSLLSGLSANTYTVEVTDLATGCIATASTTVNDAPAIPVLTYAVVPQSTCSPANSSITVTNMQENGSPIALSEYNYTLFASDGTTVLSTAGSPFEGLTAGTYFIQAEHIIRKCVSAKVEVSVSNNIVLPSIIFTRVSNSSCDVANPNGTITAAASMNSGEPAAGYTYEWFNGGLPVSGPSIGNTATIINRAAGQYSVRVTNNNTGCIATATTTLNDQPIIPVLTTSKTDQTSCTPANGIINVTGITENSVAMNINEYDFYLYGSDGITLTGISGIPFNNLTAGRYFVEAEHRIKKCRSLKVEVNIANNTTLPSVSFNKSNNFSCDIPNGAITAIAATTSGEPPLGYSFEWFNGGLPVSGPAVSSTATLGNIAGGQYSVRVINNSTGCITIAFVSIIDQPAIPVITVTKTDQNLCTPVNGTIDVTSVSEYSIATDLADYDFTLYAANGTTVLSTGALPYTGLAAGSYFVEAEHKIRKCRSAKMAVTINNIPPATTISLNRIQNTSCDAANPNGSITAVPTTAGGEPAGGYTYEWFNSGLPVSGPVIGTGSSITGRGSGNYSVRITNNTTGCVTTSTININNAPITPVVTFSKTEQTFCTPNGTINITSVTENGNSIHTSEYDFILYGADGTTNTGLAGIPFTGLAAGKYFLEAQHKVRLCKSIKYELNILLQIINPVLAFTSVNQTSCDTSNPNGSISVTANGFGSSNTDYLFEWFSGGLPINGSSTLLSNQNTIDNRLAGVYSVRVRNTVTGCVTSQSYTLQENLVIPVVSVITYPVTNCDIADGAVEATVNVGAASDYTFYWYNGTAVKALPDYAETGPLLSGILAGNYTVVAEHNITKCRSSTVVETLTESVTTVITPVIGGYPAACETNAGELTAEAVAIGNTLGFEFTWFKGNMDFSGAPLLIQTDLNSSTLSNLGFGYFTVVVKNLNNGCIASLATYLPFLDPHVVRLLDSQNSTSCSNFDGSITLDIDPASLSGGKTQDDYEFRLHEGTSLKAVAEQVIDGSNNPVVFTNLQAGNYTIEAVLKDPPYCASEPFLVTVGSDAQDPVLTETITNNTICTGNNGFLNISAAAAPGDDDSMGFNFTWYDGPTLASPTSTYFASTGNSTESTTGLPAGSYTVLIENIKTECTFTKTYFIQNIPVVIHLDGINTDQNSCAPLNGSYQVTEILENNVSAGLPAHYTFTWYDHNFDELPGNITSNEFTGLGEGIYYVEAINTNTGCKSPLKVFTIDDVSDAPEIIIVIDAPNTSCDPSASNGALSATADGQSDVDPDYSFSWSYNGNPVSTNSTLINRKEGFYTLTVTRLSTGCISSASINLPDEPAEIVISSIDKVDSENCDPDYNGRITVTGLTFNGAPGDLTNYSFTWYNAASDVFGSNGITEQDLAPGHYYIVATHNSLQCSSEPFPVTINDISDAPALIIVQDAPNTSCDPSAPNGGLSATADGQTDANADYVFSWTFNGSIIGTSSTLTSQLPGAYTLNVSRISTGCSSTLFYNLEDQKADIKIVTVNTEGSDYCDPNYNGTASVTGVTINGAAGVLANYYFTWFDANNVAFGGNGISESNLTPGQYYVIATHSILGCSSDPFPVIINNISNAPLLSIVQDAPDTSCDPTAPNGILSATADGQTDANPDYTFSWTFNGLTAGNTSTLNNRLHGLYTLTVTRASTGCINSTTFILDDEPGEILITAVNKTNSTNCNPNFNGQVYVTGVSINGAAGVLADYSFTWFDASSVAFGGNGITEQNLAPGQYYVIATHNILGCSSDPFPITIEDISGSPLIVIVQDAADTSCDPSAPNGGLSATADGQIDTNPDYTFSWSLNGNFISNSSTIVNQLNGLYTLTVTRISTGCTSSLNYYLQSMPAEIAITTVSLINSENCSPNFNGQATITGVTINGGPGVLADYSFAWFDAASVDFGGNGITEQNLAPGQYYVIATHNILSCSSDPFPLTIEDVSSSPLIVIVQDAPDTSCDPSAPNGGLSATADGQDDSDSDYTFSWSFNGSVFSNSSTVIGKLYGQYTLTVTRLSTGCTSSKNYYLQPMPAEIAITTVSLINSENCSPIFNGQATVTGVTLFGAAGLLEDYSFTWLDAASVAFGGNGITEQNLAPGQYYVIATHNNLGCSSDPFPITIEDVSSSPLIVILQDAPDTSCDHSAPNGSLSATADGLTDTDPDYTFSWTFNGNIISNSSTISNQLHGQYTLTVTRLSSGCSSLVYFNLEGQPAEIEIIAVDQVNSNNCSPGFNGHATISGVNIDGVAGILADYSYVWYNNSFIALGGNGITKQDLAPGQYYVVAYHNILGCSSNPFPFIIEDNSAFPVLAMVRNEPNSSCEPTSPNGILSSTADGFDDNDLTYTFTWYAGMLPVSGSPIATGSTIENLSPGHYTVGVMNNITGCHSYLTERIEENLILGTPQILNLVTSDQTNCYPTGRIEITQMKTGTFNDYTYYWHYGTFNEGEPVRVSTDHFYDNIVAGTYYLVALNNATHCLSLPRQVEILDLSQEPELLFNPLAWQTSCDLSAPNGQVEAFVNGSNDLNRYNFTWYSGEVPLENENKLPVGNSSMVDHLAVGLYSVVVLDNVTGCEITGSYNIRDYIPYPNIAVEVSPVTNCDPSKQNGILYATVDGSANGYSYEWFIGNEAVGSPVGTANPLTGMASHFYTVRVTNSYTLCQNEFTFFLQEEIEPVPQPEAMVMSNTFNCLHDNGIAAASVNGNTNDYIFNWYDGTTSTGTAIEGHEVTGLAAGIYSVTATDRITGCTSEKTIIVIEDEKVYPHFTIISKNSSCQLNDGSGIIVNQGTDISTVTWTQGFQTFSGAEVSNLPPGDYIVTVTNASGCSTSSATTIGTEIKVYNGISPNGDGRNDIFIVDCLENYPNNTVKIFNRAGALVYENKGYNNSNIYFDGRGNKGLYLGNSEVPDGTYYYIIEKNDGSNPKTGYLELIR